MQILSRTFAPSKTKTMKKVLKVIGVLFMLGIVGVGIVW